MIFAMKWRPLMNNGKKELCVSICATPTLLRHLQKRWKPCGRKLSSETIADKTRVDSNTQGVIHPVIKEVTTSMAANDLSTEKRPVPSWAEVFRPATLAS